MPDSADRTTKRALRTVGVLVALICFALFAYVVYHGMK